MKCHIAHESFIAPVTDDGSPLVHQLAVARTRARSHIEARLIDALYAYRARLEGRGLQVRANSRVHRWEADLVIRLPLQREARILVVESDGREFHRDVARDARRDA